MKSGDVKKDGIGLHQLESGSWIFVRRCTPSELVELGSVEKKGSDSRILEPVQYNANGVCDIWPSARRWR